MNKCVENETGALSGPRYGFTGLDNAETSAIQLCSVVGTQLSRSKCFQVANHTVLSTTSIMSMVSRVPFQLSGRYADRNAWEMLGGPGDLRVTGSQIIKDESLINAWGDKVVLVTGVSSGIGVETVRAIALTGATVYGTVRNLEKATEALGSLLETGHVHLLFMDQTDLSSVRACAEEFRKKSKKVNVIINNAAVSQV